jgi:hypothetical protein
MSDQEPVFPKAYAPEPVTWGSKNGIRYLEAAATAVRTNATYSLADKPQAAALLVLADSIDRTRNLLEYVIDSLKEESSP